MMSPAQQRPRRSIAVADRPGGARYKRSNSVGDKYDDGRASCFVKFFGFNCGAKQNVSNKKSKK